MTSQEVATVADVELVCLSRSGRPPGTTSAPAMRAARDELGGRGVPGGRCRAMGHRKHDKTPEEMW